MPQSSGRLNSYGLSFPGWAHIFRREASLMFMQISKPIVFCALLVAAMTGCRSRTADDHVRKANQYVAKARYQEAIIEFRGALRLAPRRGDIRVMLGDAYSRVNDAEGALREYVRAADLLPDNRDAQLRAGNLLLLAGS